MKILAAHRARGSHLSAVIADDDISGALQRLYRAVSDALRSWQSISPGRRLGTYITILN
jgi:hypothetical protein